MEAFGGWLDGAAEQILRGRPEGGGRRRRLRAAAGHALAYETWRALVRHQGMTHAETITPTEALVAAAARA
jgi:hypothetical protein